LWPCEEIDTITRIRIVPMINIIVCLVNIFMDVFISFISFVVVSIVVIISIIIIILDFFIFLSSLGARDAV